MEAGCTWKNLAPDLLRFPSMLAAPPDRIKGWWSLLSGFGVATTPALFGKMLRKAPFMFYINPPNIFDNEDRDYIPDDDVSATASGFVVYESLRVLQLLQALEIPDLDKVVRTQPTILLVHSTEINSRISFLFNLCLDNAASSGYLPKNSITAGAVGAAAAVGMAAAGAFAATAISGASPSTSTSSRSNKVVPDFSDKILSDEFAESDTSNTIASRQTVLGTGNAVKPRSYAISRPVWRRQSNAEHVTTTAQTKIAAASPTEEFDVSPVDDADLTTTVVKSMMKGDVKRNSLAEETKRSQMVMTKSTDTDAGSSELPRPDPASVALMEASQKKAKKLLGSLVLTYPAVLSVDYQ
jgi:hypothetical protein